MVSVRAATTEKLVYIYSKISNRNLKGAAEAVCEHELKMFLW